MRSITFGAAALVAAASLACAGEAHASLFAPPLPGTVASDAWANFSAWSGAGGFGGSYPGAAPWTSGSMPAGASTQSSGPAEFLKTSGNGYPVAFAPGDPKFIYMPTFATTAPYGNASFRAFDSTAIPGLKTVVFQLAASPGDTADPVITTAPTLNYNGGSQSLAATNVATYDVDATDGYRKYLYQWDLSSLGSVSSFDIAFGTLTNHGAIYELRVDQGTQFAAVTVPEPATLGLLGLGAAGLLCRRRRRQSGGIA